MKPIESIENLKSLIKLNFLDYCIFDEDNIEYSDIYIIYSDSKPIAMIEFISNAIQWFEVFPQFRHRGLGKQIINSILSKVDKFPIIYVIPLNEGAKRFWEKCGFVMINSRAMSRKLN